MNSTFTSMTKFHEALQAVAAEVKVPCTIRMNDVPPDEADLEEEETWQIAFNEGGPVVTCSQYIDPYRDEEEDHSYVTAALMDSNKSDAAYSMSRSLPRSMLFDLREKLIPGYINAVVETPEGFVWRATVGSEVRELPVKLYSTDNPSAQGDYAFDLDTTEANAFFDVQPCVYEDGGYIDYEKAVDKSAEKFAIRSFWWSGDGDSFGPLVRCVKFTLANGAVLHASYG